MPKNIFPLPRGMRDLTVEDTARLSWVNNKIFEVLRRYGFKVVEPSPIESLGTLEAKCGPEIKDEIYWFKDKSDRGLGLRFDMTVPAARMILSNPKLPKPVKLFYIPRMWRYEHTTSGRYREFWQAGVELFGAEGPEADAEAICAASDCLLELGLDGTRGRGELDRERDPPALDADVLDETEIDDAALEVRIDDRAQGVEDCGPG